MLHYISEGEGMPVVLIHGYTENLHLWDDLSQDLKEKYQVIRMDLPGFGKSKPEATNTMAKYAHLVLEILIEEGIRKAVFVGHSMGGYTSLEFAGLFPEYIAGIGFVHSSAYPDSTNKKAMRERTISFLKQGAVEEYARAFAPKLFAEQNRTKKDWVDQAKSTVMLCSNQSLMNAMRVMKGRRNRRSILTEIDVPYLFLAGRDDEMVPAYDMLKQAALCRRSMVHVLDDCGHISMIEKPLQYKQVVEDYLQWVYS